MFCCLKRGAMPTCGSKHLNRRQIPALYTENPAGSGVRRLPGNLKVQTLNTIRRFGRIRGLTGICVAHTAAACERRRACTPPPFTNLLILIILFNDDLRTDRLRSAPLRRYRQRRGIRSVDRIGSRD